MFKKLAEEYLSTSVAFKGMLTADELLKAYAIRLKHVGRESEDGWNGDEAEAMEAEFGSLDRLRMVDGEKKFMFFSVAAGMFSGHIESLVCKEAGI